MAAIFLLVLGLIVSWGILFANLELLLSFLVSKEFLLVDSAEQFEPLGSDRIVYDLSPDDHNQYEVLKYIHKLILLPLIISRQLYLSQVLLLLVIVMFESIIPPKRIPQFH